MTANQIIFELDEGLMTKDNFHVKLKGFVEIDSSVERDHIIVAVSQSTKNFIETIPLMEALDLVNVEFAQNIIPGLGEVGQQVTRFEISTVDAVEVGDSKPMEVGIDPSLESQKQSRGVLGKIKSLFRK